MAFADGTFAVEGISAGRADLIVVVPDRAPLPLLSVETPGEIAAVVDRGGMLEVRVDDAGNGFRVFDVVSEAGTPVWIDFAIGTAGMRGGSTVVGPLAPGPYLLGESKVRAIVRKGESTVVTIP